MKLLNLTPHGVTLFREDGSKLTLPPAPTPARASETRRPAGMLPDGTPLYTVSYGDVEGLPPVEDGTYYIVSSIVMAACPDRLDILCPYPQVRDASGRVIGCAGFSRNPKGENE